MFYPTGRAQTQIYNNHGFALSQEASTKAIQQHLHDSTLIVQIVYEFLIFFVCVFPYWSGRKKRKSNYLWPAVFARPRVNQSQHACTK